jgi:hypothetical protein
MTLRKILFTNAALLLVHLPMGAPKSSGLRAHGGHGSWPAERNCGFSLPLIEADVNRFTAEIRSGDGSAAERLAISSNYFKGRTT